MNALRLVAVLALAASQAAASQVPAFAVSFDGDPAGAAPLAVPGLGGAHPRSRPIRSIVSATPGYAVSAAACDVSATNPCPLMLSAGRAWPACRAAARWISANGANPSG